MLDEGVAQAPMDIDLAMITGAGFQFWNGGLHPAARPRGRLRGGHGLRASCPPGSPASPPEHRLTPSLHPWLRECGWFASARSAAVSSRSTTSE